MSKMIRGAIAGRHPGSRADLLAVEGICAEKRM